MPNNSNPSDFTSKIQDYHKSISEEFDIVQSGDTAAVVEQARKKLLGDLLDLTDELVGLAKHADSESVQLNAIKTCYEWVVGKDGKAEGGIADLLRDLAKNDVAE